ncbi:Beta-barrel assembly machine subunit BamA [Desulfobotulus alkaliphilus]|uniref:Outer membrane protein assembly factor BamA n=1 Tax=Desulfobotulus alkaliphilus TaxID=622671 RepID=A0A562RGM7_9BACT|nr:outer membrane protein assembly factor BamA [Desulfobotulus alkaliphilus]TWI68158.1 Beta-barrel assembly machine subunit BamA [Desulfobotulus alkaliphilus]
MNRSSFCGFWLLLLMMLGSFTAHAAESPQVWIAPFSVEGDLRSVNLGKQVAERVARELTDAGLSFQIGEEPGKDLEDVRQRMASVGAESAVWGRLILENGRFRLSGRLFSEDLERRIVEEGASVDTLFLASASLSRRVADFLVGKETVALVEIVGNQRIESDAILRVIKSGPGDVYLQKALSDDLEAIYAMGYFDDIRVAVEERDIGKVVIFTVQEKPTVRQISVRGNRVYKDDKVMEAVTTKTGSILNVFQVRRDIERIRDLYRTRNYHHSEVHYEIRELDNNQADLVFTISEGEKVKITEIVFEGRESFTHRQLRKQTGLSEKGFFSWLTGSGELKQEAVQHAAARLTAFYHNEGYVDARVSDPEISFEDSEARILFRIVEGQRYRIGEVSVGGDQLLPEDVLLSMTSIGNEEWYKRDVVHQDMMALTDLYADAGYANTEVFPQLRKDSEAGVVDILYMVRQGEQVYIDRIEITGNVKTRDKVIRRQIPLLEQELYSGSRIRRGVRNLNRLDYFEDVQMDIQRTQDPEKVDLLVSVEEKPTGMFTFGAGYSSQDNLFGQVSVTQRNFMGKGQTLNLRADVSSTSTRYTLSFTEPYLFDKPLSAGFDVYNWDREYNDYTKKSTGGTVRLSYPVWDYTRAFVSYGIESFDVKVDSGKEQLVNEDILAMEPLSLASTMTLGLSYDSTNRLFNPSEGAKHRLTVKHAGGPLGGDIAFTKYTAEAGWYFPLFWETVFFMHGETGYVHKNSDGHLPDYEKFYLGGLNSVRGYRWRDIAVYYDGDYTYYKKHEDDTITKETIKYRKNKGGDKFIQANLEFIFPLVREAGLMGLVFYDIGNVYDTDERIRMDGIKRSAGYGIRWFSPIGPIRLEYGIPLDRIDGSKQSARWEFTMGGAF